MLDVTRDALNKALSNGSHREHLNILEPHELKPQAFENHFCSLWARGELTPTIGPWFFANKECTRFAFLTTNETIATFTLMEEP
ncbi:hypothetical protein SEA_MOSSY_45 [Gordonia phage Mossy]|nr:hypothetical protein SEA_MOSSY_45 [Gordonia phage Mossy]